MVVVLEAGSAFLGVAAAADCRDEGGVACVDVADVCGESSRRG